MRHSEPGFGEFVGVKRFELARLIEVLVHAVVGLHLGRLLLQVVGAVRVDLHLRLALLAARRVLLEVDADELPFLGPFGYLGGSESLHLLGRRLADLARVPHLRLVALGFDDVGGGGFVPQLELEVEALAFLRAARDSLFDAPSSPQAVNTLAWSATCGMVANTLTACNCIS